MQISEVTAFLENAYDILNCHYFNSELPRAVITVQSSPKAYGHYTPYDAWKEESKGYREINLGAEHLNRPIFNTIATLVHEQTHFYCQLNGIKDTSRGGTYHNKRFKTEAEKRGLIIDHDPKIGFSLTQPSPELIDFVNQQGWQGVNLARTGLCGASSGGGDDGGTGGKKSAVRKYQCPSCGCSVRATKEVHIGCLDCNEEMFLIER